MESKHTVLFFMSLLCMNARLFIDIIKSKVTVYFGLKTYSSTWHLRVEVIFFQKPIEKRILQKRGASIDEKNPNALKTNRYFMRKTLNIVFTFSHHRCHSYGVYVSENNSIYIH